MHKSIHKIAFFFTLLVSRTVLTYPLSKHIIMVLILRGRWQLKEKRVLDAKCKTSHLSRRMINSFAQLPLASVTGRLAIRWSEVRIIGGKISFTVDFIQYFAIITNIYSYI